MRSSHSKKKEDLIYRISLSRVRVLTETDKLANGMGALPAMLSDACGDVAKGMKGVKIPGLSAAKSAAKSVTNFASSSKSPSPSAAADAPATAAAVSALAVDSTLEFYSPAEVAEKERSLLLLCAVVSTVSALCFLPSARLLLARLVRSLLAFTIRSLRNLITKVLLPSLLTGLKGVFKTLFSMK